MSIIKNPDSLNAAIQCTAVIAQAMTAASVYPQDGPIYQEYQKCILSLSAVADRLAKDALAPVPTTDQETPVDNPEVVEPPLDEEDLETPAVEDPEPEENQKPAEQEE